MTQTLMADYEDEPSEGIFPATSQSLFIGGPKHGEEIETVDGDPVWKVFAPAVPSPTDRFPVFGAAEPHTYIRREFGVPPTDTEPGYVRAVYVHESIPNPQVAQQLLLAALLANFVKGGRKVIPGDVPDSRSTSGG